MSNLLFKRRLTETISIAPVDSTMDGHGFHGHGTAVNNLSLLVNKRKLVRDDEGNEVVSSARIYVKNTWSSPKVTDKLTPVDGSVPTIIAIDTIKDHRNVINHYVAFLE